VKGEKLVFIGLCHKCTHKITEEGESVTLPSGQVVKSQKIIGCKICENPDGGRKCPLKVKSEGETPCNGL